MDRAQLAHFLRTRRERLQPEEVGLPHGARRRAPGLRREEAALLAGMSADYWSRLEQQRGPQPSTQMLRAVSRALRLSLAERDHLYRLSGHPAPERSAAADEVSFGMRRILDRLHDTPAFVITELGEMLAHTPPAVALFGDTTGYTGLARAVVYRWYTDPDSRAIYPQEDHDRHAAGFTSELRSALSRGGPRSRAAEIVAALLERSPEFAARWEQHVVGEKQTRQKRLRHPELGTMTVDCDTLLDASTQHRLLVFTAEPGSPDAEKLALLSVIAGR